MQFLYDYFVAENKIIKCTLNHPNIVSAKIVIMGKEKYSRFLV